MHGSRHKRELVPVIRVLLSKKNGEIRESKHEETIEIMDVFPYTYEED